MNNIPPLTNYSINQQFGANANDYYKGEKLKGHPGTDFGAPFGSTIFHAHGGYVYSTLNKDNKDLSKYRAVCVIAEENGELVEFIYGHLKEIFCSAGDTVVKGQPLGTLGNTGIVYSGTPPTLVTEEEKENGSTRGAHLHYQKRPVARVTVTDDKHQYIIGPNGLYQDKNGFYYLVPDFTNGYNGCVDGLPDIKHQSITDWLTLFSNVLSLLLGKH